MTIMFPPSRAITRAKARAQTMTINFENIENAQIKRAFLFNSKRRRLLNIFKHNPARVFVLIIMGNDQRELPLLVWPDTRDSNTREICANLHINLDSDLMANPEQVRAAILTRRFNAHWRDTFDLSVKMQSEDEGWTSATVQITKVKRGDALSIGNAKFDYLIGADGKVIKHKQHLQSILKPEYLKACGISIVCGDAYVEIVRGVDVRNAGLDEEDKLTATEKEKLAKLIYGCVLRGEDVERDSYKVRKFNRVRDRQYDAYYETWKKLDREVVKYEGK